MDHDTVYQAASLTKPLFALVVMQLVREKSLELDRPVHEYLALPNADDPRARSITARHLLSHSSGWRNWRNRATDALTCDFDPGSRWSYSGEGYYFLQRIVERVTGTPIAQLMRERLFTPLGMTRSSLVGLESLDPHLATGHGIDGSPRAVFMRPTLLALRARMAERQLPLDAAREEDVHATLQSAQPTLPVLPNYLAPNTASSLLTTTADLARALTWMLGDGRSLAREMVTPQVRRNEALQWGLGLGIESVAGRSVGWQWGDNPGFKNFFALDLDGGTGTVALTNGDRGARVYERVIRQVTGVDHPAFLFV